MTNIYTKIVIIAILALGITLAGCKKDEPTSPTFTVATSSMDFEWGQTKQLTYSVYRIRNFGTPTVPTGWTCVQRDGSFFITSPAEGTTSQLSGKVTLTCSTEIDSTITRDITVAVKIAEPIAGQANSLIVSEPGKRYKFNALRRGNESSETITGATAATRLWSTSKSAIVNVSYENGYIYFATADADLLEEANTLVAVTDKDDNVLWSWHIWATDYDPAAEPDFLGGIMVMNRNLGAFTNSNATPGDALRSYGLYYQWGRKDPFIGPAAWNSTAPASIYNSSGQYVTHKYLVSSAEIGTIDYTVANPAAFIAGAEDNNYDWLYTGTNARWNSASKSIYDPCPAGWKVAPPTIWASFTTTGAATSDPAEFSIEGDYEYGWNFVVNKGADGAPDITVFFPAAGRRSFSPSLAKPEDNFTNVVNNSEGVGYPVGFYWSSAQPTPPASPAIYPYRGTGSLAFGHNYINPASVVRERSEHAPAGGFPLRCVAES